jgi:predicted DCC family thiol-disulfide oxidoreductase YuxK
MKLTTLVLFYDNFCPNCTKFAKLVQKLDWLQLLEIKQLRNELHTNSFREIDLHLAKQQMASFATRWHYGFNSLYFIFTRLPLFWITVPFLYVLKVTSLGELLYAELALKRKIIPIHCNDNCEI